MTVSTNDTVERYTISGVGPYAYSWRIFNDTDLTVVALSTDDPPEVVPLTYLTHYTVTGANAASGGSITLVSSAHTTYAGYTLDIRSNTPENQLTSIRNQARFLPEIHEDAFDYLSRQIQDVNRRLERTVRFSDDTLSSGEMTPIQSWLSKYLAVGPTGLLEPTTLTSSGALTATILGLLLYPRTASEISASVIPTNYAYPPLYVDRYGTNSTPGTTDMAAAFQAAIDVAKVGGGTIVFGATAPYLITSALDCTVPSSPAFSNNKSYSFRGEGQVTAITLPTSQYAPDLIFQHTGHAFDCTGTKGIDFENVTITTNASTYPQTCFLLARNTDESSMQCRFTNVRIIGSFSKAAYYLYGAEETVWIGCQTFNRAADANAKCFILTQNNIRSVTSTFTTIATGSQSSLGYNWYGCSSLMFSDHATADVFEIEGCNFGKMFGGWASCANGSGGGRSLIYVNTTNGFPSGWTFIGFQGEAAGTQYDYGVLFGTEHAAGAYGGVDWTFISCQFPHAVRMIGGGDTDCTLANLTLMNVTDESIGSGGVNFAGILSNPQELGVAGGIVGGSITTPNLHALNHWWQRAGEVNLTLWDSTAASNELGYRVRAASGQLVISLLDNSGNVATNLLVADRTGTTADSLVFGATQLGIVTPTEYADDAAASAGGLAVGRIYRTGSALKVRVA